jgi:hypothetical protein
MRLLALMALLAMTLVPTGSLWAQSVDLPQILAQQRELAAQLKDGSLALTPRAFNIVKKAQQEVFALSDGKTTLAELNIAEKTRLENALERINASVVGTRAAAGGKQVCKRVPVTGSAMKTTRCATQAEWDDVREQSRNSLEKQRVCEPPGCGS